MLPPPEIFETLIEFIFFWQDDFFYKVTASLAPHVVQGPRLDAKNLQGTKLFAAVKSVEGLPPFLFSQV